MTRFSWIILLGLVVGACGGDDEAPLGAYSEECTVTEDCEEGLECATGLCTPACGTTADCAAVDSSGKSICMSNGYCYIACMSLQSCPAHLSKCEMVGTTQGTCRP